MERPSNCVATHLILLYVKARRVGKQKLSDCWVLFSIDVKKKPRKTHAITDWSVNRSDPDARLIGYRRCHANKVVIRTTVRERIALSTSLTFVRCLHGAGILTAVRVALANSLRSSRIEQRACGPSSTCVCRPFATASFVPSCCTLLFGLFRLVSSLMIRYLVIGCLRRLGKIIAAAVISCQRFSCSSRPLHLRMAC